MTFEDLEADLARLLRDGLVQIDRADDESDARFQITARGRSYVDEHEGAEQAARGVEVGRVSETAR
jgi:DNA-binding PadR family transcriptional regulator